MSITSYPNKEDRKLCKCTGMSALKQCCNSSTVMNLVYELPLTHHQRSLAHHMDSCTTLTVVLHLRLQFPSSIALTTHKADCTDSTDRRLYINHRLPFLLCRVLFIVKHSPSVSYLPSLSVFVSVFSLLY